MKRTDCKHHGDFGFCNFRDKCRKNCALFERRQPKTETAEFCRSGNDLSWKACFYIVGEFFHLKWYGYNDENWWLNVAPKQTDKTFKGDKGTERKFRIDFVTNIVSEIVEAL